MPVIHFWVGGTFTMKSLLKLFVIIYVGLYRLTRGRIGGRTGRSNVLLLTTKGRKTGKVRTVPLGCFDYDGGWAIVASNNGQPTHPAWYLNLKSHPQASVEAFGKVLAVKAEELRGEARSKAWQRVIATAPSYARYEQRTAREIPVLLLHRTV